MGIPVTTPTAKLSPKILAQNLAARLYFSSPVSQGTPFPVNQEPGKSHGELRKQVTVRESEPEVDPVPESRVG